MIGADIAEAMAEDVAADTVASKITETNIAQNCSEISTSCGEGLYMFSAGSNMESRRARSACVSGF